MSPDALSVGESAQIARAEVGPWELPDGWTWAPLNEVTEPPANIDPKKQGRAFSYIDLSAISAGRIGGAQSLKAERAPSRAKQLVKLGDILFSGVRVYLKNIAFVDEIHDGAVASTAFCVLRPIAAVDSRYLYYFVNSQKFINCLLPLQRGNSPPAVLDSDIKVQLIPLAPANEQRRIVARIDELFAEIAEGEAALQRSRLGLDTWRRALLKAAVTGELTRDWREANRPAETGADLLTRIRTERKSLVPKSRRRPPHATVDVPDTSLEAVPEGWELTTWQEVGVSQNGRAFPSSEYTTDGVKLLRPGNLYADGSVRWNEKNSRYLPVKFIESANDLLIGGSELVINLTAQSLKDEFLGRVCLTATGERCLLNQRLARLTPFIISRNFMLIVFKSPLFRSFVNNLNSGSLIQHMFTSQMDRFGFPLPPAAEQDVIVKRVEDGLAALSETAQSIDAELQTTALLRQSILKAAFEGRLVPQNPADEAASVPLSRLRTNYPGNGARRRRTRAAADFSHPSLPGLSQSVDPRVEPAGDE